MPRLEGDGLDLTAPFPNRLIYVNDPANESMALCAQLGPLLREASVFLVSTFNAMRAQGRSIDEIRNSLIGAVRSSPEWQGKGVSAEQLLAKGRKVKVTVAGEVRNAAGQQRALKQAATLKVKRR